MKKARDGPWRGKEYGSFTAPSYVPYKIGKLQIQGFSEPTTPKNKITELSHYAEGRPVKTTGGIFAWKARKEAEIF